MGWQMARITEKEEKELIKKYNKQKQEEAKSR